jgi:hypothetical protein
VGTDADEKIVLVGELVNCCEQSERSLFELRAFWMRKDELQNLGFAAII